MLRECVCPKISTILSNPHFDVVARKILYKSLVPSIWCLCPGREKDATQGEVCNLPLTSQYGEGLL